MKSKVMEIIVYGIKTVALAVVFFIPAYMVSSPEEFITLWIGSSFLVLGREGKRSI